MAPASYYYLLSLILAGGAMLWLLNLLFIRIKGVTVLGKISKVGTAGHGRILNLASKRNILITALIVLMLSINLASSILTVLSLNGSDKYLLLTSMPIVIAILYALGIYKLRKDYRYLRLDHKSKEKKEDGKINKDDSWLS